MWGSPVTVSLNVSGHMTHNIVLFMYHTSYGIVSYTLHDHNVISILATYFTYITNFTYFTHISNNNLFKLILYPHTNFTHAHAHCQFYFTHITNFTYFTYTLLTLPITGADPKNLHGRWLAGWLPIVNHTGAKGVAG